MSASQALPLGAMVYQLSASLRAYEEDLRLLLVPPFDPQLYRRISGRVDEMRLYAGSLPTLSAAWVEVLIRHFELTHGLFQPVRAGRDELDRLHRQLGSAVQRLERRCLLLMPGA